MSIPKMYEIQDVRTRRIYRVVSDSFQGACQQVGVMPADAVLLSAPKPVPAPPNAQGQVHDPHGKQLTLQEV